MWCGLLLLLCSSVLVNVFASCPCQDVSLCKPVSVGPRKEIFIFQVSQANWRMYDWTQVTTIALFDKLDPQLLCKAHAEKVRIVWGANYPTDQLANATNRQVWIQQQVQLVLSTYTDGINVDFEDQIAMSSPNRQLLTQLLAETRQAFRSQLVNVQLTFDVAWSPNCIDGRCYDWVGLANYTDFLFVMSYDLRSQIFGPCIASANSPLSLVQQGLLNFTRLGIQPNQLVLGVPWYGYNYECLSIDQNSICSIAHVPFRGVNCSDAAGTEYPYSTVIDWLNTKSTTGRVWNETLKSPFFNYKDSSTGKIYQVWYDDVESLTYKYEVAKSFNLRGVGMWTADFLDYKNQAQVSAMWNALKKFKN